MKKGKLLAVVSILSIFFSLGLTAFIMIPAIDQNSMEEYCTVTSSYSRYPGKAGETFVREVDGIIRTYDPATQTNSQEFLIQKSDSEYRITDANWLSQGRLCKLKMGKVLIESAQIILVFSMVIFILIYLLYLLFYSLFSFFTGHKETK